MEFRITEIQSWAPLTSEVVRYLMCASCLHASVGPVWAALVFAARVLNCNKLLSFATRSGISDQIWIEHAGATIRACRPRNDSHYALIALFVFICFLWNICKFGRFLAVTMSIYSGVLLRAMFAVKSKCCSSNLNLFALQGVFVHLLSAHLPFLSSKLA